MPAGQKYRYYHNCFEAVCAQTEKIRVLTVKKKAAVPQIIQGGKKVYV
jgi:hypothetical protein